MKYNTICKNCIFSNTADSNKACSFDIIESIKQNKTITTDDAGFYKIENYVCRFCFSKNFYEKHILTNKSYCDIDIKEYIKIKNQIKYYLIINVKESCDLKKLYQNIKSLDIKPKLTSLILYNFSSNKLKDLMDIFEDNKNLFKYKFHNFIEDINKNAALFTVMDTYTDLTNNKANYLLILDSDSVENFTAKKSILQINYIINIIQPDSNILKKYDTEGNFNSVFMTIDNYKGITKNINQSLEDGLNSTEDLTVTYYD